MYHLLGVTINALGGGLGDDVIAGLKQQRDAVGNRGGPPGAGRGGRRWGGKRRDCEGERRILTERVIKTGDVIVATGLCVMMLWLCQNCRGLQLHGASGNPIGTDEWIYPQGPCCRVRQELPRERRGSLHKS